MIHFSLKKPYTVIVSIIVCLVLGVISFTRMTTDLLPSIELPYIVIYATLMTLFVVPGMYAVFHHEKIPMKHFLTRDNCY